MVYVRFVDEKGAEIVPMFCVDRMPGPGEEIRLGDDWYVVQPTPIRNEPMAFPSGTRYVANLVAAKKKSEAPVTQSSRKAKGHVFKEVPV